MFVCYECCVLSGRGLCNGLITRPEDSYRLWYVVVCDLETSGMRRPWPTGDCCGKKNDNREETESIGKKARPSATLSTKISHGLVQN